jgi:hypothetical protein
METMSVGHLVLSWILAFGQASSADPKTKEALLEELGNRFERIGPFVAEFTFEGSPGPEVDGKRYQRIVVAADLTQRRLHYGVAGLPGEPDARKWLMHFNRSDAYLAGPDGQVTKLAQSALMFAFPEILDNLGREIAKAGNEPDPGRGTVLRPAMNFEVKPRPDGTKGGMLSVGLGLTHSGQPIWLVQISQDQGIRWVVKESEVLWESPSGWKVEIDRKSGFFKFYEIKGADGKPVRLTLKSLSQGALPADAVPPDRYDAQPMTPKEGAELFYQFAESILAAIKKKWGSGEIREDVLEATLTAISAAEVQILRLQIRREMVSFFVRKALTDGMKLDDLRTHSAEMTEAFAKALTIREPALRKGIQDQLEGSRERLIGTFGSKDMGKEQLDQLKKIVGRAYRLENSEKVGPIVPARSNEDLLKEVLAEAVHLGTLK